MVLAGLEQAQGARERVVRAVLARKERRARQAVQAVPPACHDSLVRSHGVQLAQQLRAVRNLTLGLCDGGGAGRALGPACQSPALGKRRVGNRQRPASRLRGVTSHQKVKHVVQLEIGAAQNAPEHKVHWHALLRQEDGDAAQLQAVVNIYIYIYVENTTTVVVRACGVMQHAVRQWLRTAPSKEDNKPSPNTAALRPHPPSHREAGSKSASAGRSASR